MKKLFIGLMMLGSLSAFASVDVRIEIETNVTARNSVAEINFQSVDDSPNMEMRDIGNKIVIEGTDIDAAAMLNFTLCSVKGPIKWHRYRIYVNDNIVKRSVKTKLPKRRACFVGEAS